MGKTIRNMNSDKNCLFCKIIAKEIPASIVFEDDKFIVFKDIFPKAQIHLLVDPKEHIASLAHLEYNHRSLMGEALLLLNTIAKENNATNGFRTLINTGSGGGQDCGAARSQRIRGQAVREMEDRQEGQGQRHTYPFGHGRAAGGDRGRLRPGRGH